jgi:putative membrane protein
VWKHPIVRFVSFATVATSATAVLAQPVQQSGTPLYGPWYDGYGWQFWWICPLMMLLMFVVVAIFFFGRRHAPDSAQHWMPPWHASDTALQILSERFARGEIGNDEYQQKKASILSRG